MASANEAGIPFLTTDQMREVDRAMIDDYGIHLIQMMENAGRNLAQLARRRFLADDPNGRRVLILAGTGGNGGGGLVCARHLHNWGANVTVWTTAPAGRLTEVPRHQHSILQRMDVDLVVADENARLPDADLIIDAIIGYSLSGDPRGPSASLIRAANGHGAPVLALDAPSGIDTAAGTVHDPSVNATVTMTLALPKEGLRSESAREHVGELYLADISVPPKLYGDAPLNLAVGAIFAREEVLRIW